MLSPAMIPQGNMVHSETRHLFSDFGFNILTNGDAESGPCETTNGVTPPTDWNYYGLITQIAYRAENIGPMSFTSIGPR